MILSLITFAQSLLLCEVTYSQVWELGYRHLRGTIIQPTKGLLPKHLVDLSSSVLALVIMEFWWSGTQILKYNYIYRMSVCAHTSVVRGIKVLDYQS